MINEDGTPNTAHTKNLVPCIYISNKSKNVTLSDGRLSDIAPTVLALLGLQKPKAMDGKNLILAVQ